MNKECSLIRKVHCPFHDILPDYHSTYLINFWVFLPSDYQDYTTQCSGKVQLQVQLVSGEIDLWHGYDVDTVESIQITFEFSIQVYKQWNTQNISFWLGM